MAVIGIITAQLRGDSTDFEQKLKATQARLKEFQKSSSDFGSYRDHAYLGRSFEHLGKAISAVNPELGESISKLGDLGRAAAMAEHAQHALSKSSGILALATGPVGIGLAAVAAAGAAAYLVYRSLTEESRRAAEAQTHFAEAQKKVREEEDKSVGGNPYMEQYRTVEEQAHYAENQLKKFQKELATAQKAAENIAGQKVEPTFGDRFAKSMRGSGSEVARQNQAATRHADDLKAASDAVTAAKQKLDEAQAASDKANEKLRSQKIPAENERAERELHKLKIEGIQDEHQKAVDLIRFEYSEKIKLADKTNVEILKQQQRQALLNEQQKNAVRVEAERQRQEAEQQHQEAERQRQIDQDLADANKLAHELQRQHDETARLEIEANQTGTKQKLALIELEKEQQIRAAKEAGLSVAEVERQTALKKMRVASEVADKQRKLADEIAELELEASAKSPLEKQLARIEKRRKDELAAAQKEGLSAADVNKKYDLEKKIALQKEKDTHKDTKFAGATAWRSRDNYSMFVRHQFGGSGKNTEERALECLQQLVNQGIKARLSKDHERREWGHN